MAKPYKPDLQPDILIYKTNYLWAIYCLAQGDKESC